MCVGRYWGMDGAELDARNDGTAMQVEQPLCETTHGDYLSQL